MPLKLTNTPAGPAMPHRAGQALVSEQKSDNSKRTPHAAELPTPPTEHDEASHEAKFYVCGFPARWDANDIFNQMKPFGMLVRIDVPRDCQRPTQTNAFVTFNLPPRTLTRMGRSVGLLNYKTKKPMSMFMDLKPQLRQPSPHDSSITFHEKTSVKADLFQWGIMKHETNMLALHTLDWNPQAPIIMLVDLKFKCLEFVVKIDLAIDTERSTDSCAKDLRTFKIRLPLAQVAEMASTQTSSGGRAFTIRAAAPPSVFQRNEKMDPSPASFVDLWTDEQTWVRQTRIWPDDGDQEGITKLYDDECVVDIGRWLTYRVEFNASTALSGGFQDMCRALDHFMETTTNQTKHISVARICKMQLWQPFQRAVVPLPDIAGPLDMFIAPEDMWGVDVLPFPVRYQLEACISNGALSECSVDRAFVRQLIELAEQAPTRAVRLLEALLDRKNEGDLRNCEDPANFFSKMLPKVPYGTARVPRYCAMIRSAVVTPTTIYFQTPFPETSNRVVRRFRQHEDRFLRVKFTDERYKGKLYGGDGESMNKAFSRIKRTMKNGIEVGGRLFEFLAFGNAQFREGGAYFFASTPSLSAQDIRDWMGNFSHIKVVAKYCSRLGQSFSTTRAMQIGVSIERLPDIERNGFTFTDGVGKISPFLARMIAQEFGLPCSEKDSPSCFQFRLGGCKGVLAVDPVLSRNTIQIRPSQEKFSAMQHRGLEICRIARYSSANLNMQLILVLSTLGVPDHYFLDKMKKMLKDLAAAMIREDVAIELLQKNVDFNQMTIKLAGMVRDGFMQTRDPFTITCLRLWRCWSIKYLKEKAKIFIENGAFVIGCVDETGILHGHFHDDPTSTDASKSLDRLPQIFLQIPDPDTPCEWKIVQGLCVVARNPSLHPGDVRVVMAVDIPELRHLRDCVVFPQTGDRDIPNMLSGGDLDGDDFVVMWDRDGIPEEWNHPPMNYHPPQPQAIDGTVTVDAMTSFFVQHMRFDNLGPIAVAHRHWADFKDEGVKDPYCLELAELHSIAVDYQKTGRHAEMGKHLRIGRFPHWSEQERRPMYTSRKILGKLYDEVQREPFDPAWEAAFDDRIMAVAVIDDTLRAAIDLIKVEYDAAVRRLMARFGIHSEFEIWTTFVLKHSNDFGDYKLAESMGHAVEALKEHYQDRCYESAGTNRGERDRKKMDTFVAAMYAFTAEQISDGLSLYEAADKPVEESDTARRHKLGFMPLMSFPWLFAEDLGRIANGQSNLAVAALPLVARPMMAKTSKAHKPTVGDDFFELAHLPAIVTEEGEVRGGDLLDLFHKDDAEEVGNGQEHESLSPAEYDNNNGLRPMDAAVNADLPTTTPESALSRGVALEPGAVGNTSNVMRPQLEAISSRPTSSDKIVIARSAGPSSVGCSAVKDPKSFFSTVSSSDWSGAVTVPTSPLQPSFPEQSVCSDATAAPRSANSGVSESSPSEGGGSCGHCSQSNGGEGHGLMMEERHDAGAEQAKAGSDMDDVDGYEAARVVSAPILAGNAIDRLDALLKA